MDGVSRTEALSTESSEKAGKSRAAVDISGSAIQFQDREAAMLLRAECAFCGFSCDVCWKVEAENFQDPGMLDQSLDSAYKHQEMASEFQTREQYAQTLM